MVRWLGKQRYGPIGVDIGTRSVKLVQLSADASQLVDAARWDLGSLARDKSAPNDQSARLVAALRQAREGKGFRGRDAVLCLTDRELFVQNVRVPKVESAELTRLVHQEAASRLPFPVAEAEVRFLETADIRQGEAVVREVILLACHRPVLESLLAAIEGAGLKPVGVDVEPVALMRNYARQFRRDEDRTLRTLFVHVGHSRTAAVIVQGDEILFLKYIEGGGQQLDEAVARHLAMPVAEAAALRKHNGDRRGDQQDPEIARSVAEGTRPVVDRLAGELALCARYQSVTFRGSSLARLLLGGGEATPQLLEALGERLNLKCELSDPLRGYTAALPAGRKGQWDVAAGLALRERDKT
jgi:type IV pilus assembly protein PilM